MKIVLHKAYGLYGHTGVEWLDKLLKKYDFDRSNDELVKAIENYDGNIRDLDCHKIAEIPDNVTDFCVYDYDGYEYVIYVIDGKLYGDGVRTQEDVEDE